MSNPYLALLRMSWRHAGPLRGRMALLYSLFTVTHLLLALRPALYGWFIDRIQRQTDNALHSAWLYGTIFLCITLAQWAIHGPCRVLEQKLAFDVSLKFLAQQFHQTLHLPLRWHQDHHSGATISRVRKGYEALRSFLANGFDFLFVPCNMGLSLIAMLYFSPVFGSVAVVMACLIVWMIVRFDRPLIPQQHDLNELEHALSATMFDTLSNIQTVITLRLEPRMQAGLIAKARAIYPPFHRWAVLNETKWWAAETLVALTYVIIVIGYVQQHYVPGQTFYVGGLVALIGYVSQFTGSFTNITWQYAMMVHHQTDIGGADIIARAYADAHRPGAPARLPAGWHRCTITGLNHAHRDGEGASLRDITVTLERGKRLALVGESGSGKSTLLALLRGLYQADPGVAVTVDDHPRSLEALNETTTLLPQDPEIFENTIEYNVTLGLAVPDEEIRRVCEVAHFTQVIAELPHGLASNIQEKGVNLSGGQKQRLALARGILSAQDCDVVLLDEPSSSVDPKTELQIYTKMFRDFENKAVVSALHRLHLLRLFDSICVLHHGRIVGCGTLEELLNSNAHFQDLWRHREDETGAN